MMLLALEGSTFSKLRDDDVIENRLREKAKRISFSGVTSELRRSRPSHKSLYVEIIERRKQGSPAQDLSVGVSGVGDLIRTFSAPRKMVK